MRKFELVKVVCMVAVFCAAAAVGSSAQTYTPLADFDGSNGNSPYLGALIQGTDGNFFGTTQRGGRYDYGEIYAVSPSGTLGRIYSFCSVKFVCPDGQTPYGSVMQAANGNFYGTTAFGGANNGGTLFELTPAGTLTTLYSFPNGSTPSATLVQGFNGYLYGAANSSGVNVYGTIFAVNPATGTVTTVYTFCSKPHCADGSAGGGAGARSQRGLLRNDRRRRHQRGWHCFRIYPLRQVNHPLPLEWDHGRHGADERPDISHGRKSLRYSRLRRT